jgi:hypothetical protein
MKRIKDNSFSIDVQIQKNDQKFVIEKKWNRLISFK